MHLRIHKKMLTSTYFLLKFFTIFPFFLHNLIQVRYSITGFPLFCSMFLSPMLLKRVVTWELLSIRRADHRLLRTWLSVLLRNMITHLIFALCKKMTVWTLMFLLFFTSLRCRAAFWRLYIIPQFSPLIFTFLLRAGII